MNLPSLKRSAPLAAGAAALTCATPAFAHPGLHHVVLGLASGFAHPFTGADHVLAFAAIGLWTAQYGDRRAWLLPLLFLVAMAVGAFGGLAAVPASGVETGIALSVAVLGLLVAFAVRMPLPLAATLVSAFALLHGYAHGTELPREAGALSFLGGMLGATALLHLAGYAAGTAAARLTRLAGIGIAAGGMLLLAAAI